MSNLPENNHKEIEELKKCVANQSHSLEWINLTTSKLLTRLDKISENHLPHIQQELSNTRMELIEIRAELKPIQRIVYGASGIILIAVFTAIVALVIK